MTTADRTAAPAATSPDFVEHRVVRTHYEAPTYAGGHAIVMPNYTVTGGHSSDISWPTVVCLGIAAIFLAAVLAFVFKGDAILGGKAYYDATKSIGVAQANASAGVPTDVDNNGVITACTGKCWDAQKVKAATTSNARAGFGSNTGTDTVNAVAPPNNVAAPAPKVVYPPAPVYAPPRSTCNTCGVGPSASLPGKIDTCDNGQQTNRPRPTNGVWGPKVNPRSGQCTWWNAAGAVPQYRS